MLTKEELAARLNGREYTEEITKDEEAEAKAAGLVVVFGASDDLMEFKGAINEEIGAPSAAIVDAYGLVPSRDDLVDNITEMDDAQIAAEFSRRISGNSEIKAIWTCGGEYCWEYETTIPHATFDIMEGGEKFCRGIVFDLPGKGA